MTSTRVRVSRSSTTTPAGRGSSRLPAPFFARRATAVRAPASLPSSDPAGFSFSQISVFPPSSRSSAPTSEPVTLARQDLDAGTTGDAFDAGFHAPSCGSPDADLVIAYLNETEPDAPGVGNLPRARELLEGLPVADLLETLELLAGCGYLDVLDQDPLPEGEYPRLEVSLRIRGAGAEGPLLVDLEALRGLMQRLDADDMAAIADWVTRRSGPENEGALVLVALADLADFLVERAPPDALRLEDLAFADPASLQASLADMRDAFAALRALDEALPVSSEARQVLSAYAYVDPSATRQLIDIIDAYAVPPPGAELVPTPPVVVMTGAPFVFRAETTRDIRYEYFDLTGAPLVYDPWLEPSAPGNLIIDLVAGVTASVVRAAVEATRSFALLARMPFSRVGAAGVENLQITVSEEVLSSRVLSASSLAELEPLEGTIVLGHYTRPVFFQGVRVGVEEMLPTLEAWAARLGGRTLSTMPGEIEVIAPALRSASRIVFFTTPGMRGLTALEMAIIQSEPALMAKTWFILGGFP